MTKEQRTFIAPSDILGIEYECGNCHAKHLVPVKRFDRVLYRCPNCQEGLATALGPGDASAKDDTRLHAFVDALQALDQLTVKLRLEIKDNV